MTELDYQVERDAIEFAYAQKLAAQDNVLREQATHILDLKMQIAAVEQQQYQAAALRDQLEIERDRELLELQKEYAISIKG